MTAMNFRLMNPLKFGSIYNWSVNYANAVEQKYSDKYKLVSIGDFLKRNKRPIEIQDKQLYKRVKIRINGGGISVRDEVLGNEIGTKSQFIVESKQFLLSKIDARNGAFGVVPDECNGAIITGNFWTFDVDYEQINPFYLKILTSSKRFQILCQNASNGTTNRNYLQEGLFLGMQIPLPDIETQNQFTSQYNQQFIEAQTAENQANELEKGIERYLLDELGIEVPEVVEKKKGLQVIRLKELSRWGVEFVLNNEDDIFSILKKAKYPSSKFGQIYDFINRPWSSKKHENNTFKYIEIGSVDSFKGITNFSEIEIKNASSRATQIVKESDLILGLTRPNLKKFALVNEQFDGYVCSSGFQIISPSDDYNLEFLLEFLKSEVGVKQVSYFMAGALYPAITSKQLKELEIPLPPKEIQTQIVNHITSQKEQIKTLRQQAEALRRQAKEEFEQEIFI